MYEVIAAPPSLAGAVNETVAVVEPVDVAVPIVGVPGTVGLINTELLGLLFALLPKEFVAYTVNVYALPNDNPVTVIGLVVPVAYAPVFAVTVYDVIAEPLVAPAVKGTLIEDESTKVGVPTVGASGTLPAKIELLGALAMLVPCMFVACTLNV